MTGEKSTLSTEKPSFLRSSHSFGGYKMPRKLRKSLVVYRLSTDNCTRPVWLSYAAQIPITKADFNYTTDRGEWKDRRWTTVAAKSQGQHKFQAALPPGVSAYYFNLIDEHGLVVSSDLRFLAGSPRKTFFR